MTSRAIRLLGLMLTLSLLVGCVRESTNGDTRIFSYELWASGLIFLGGLIAIPVGWMLRNSSRFGWALLIMGPIAAFGFAPSMFMDYVDVSPSGFSRHSGIWGMTSVQDVKFADVGSIRATIEEERGRRGRKIEKLYGSVENLD